MAITGAAGQQSSSDWRGTLERVLTHAYLQRGVVIAVRRDALTSSSATLLWENERDLKLKSVGRDVLHQRSVIVLERRGSNGIVVLSSEVLPPFASRLPVTAKEKRPVLVKAGEQCRAAMNDGKLLMRLRAKALNSAGLGEIARVTLDGEHNKILRTVVTGRGEVEVLP
ncbi:MAG: flagella basal body P-ring formation protein FlgA [Acidobacteriaceae bacterium]